MKEGENFQRERKECAAGKEMADQTGPSEKNG